MALTKTTINANAATLEMVQTSATITADDDITGGVTGNLQQVDIDNSNTPTTAVYVKLADVADATAGTTEPNWCFRAPGGQRTSYTCLGASPFATGLSLWCSTEAGKASATNPSGTVSVRILVGTN